MADTPAACRHRSAVWSRQTAAVALAAGEVIAFSVCFDLQGLAGSPDCWAVLLLQAPTFARLGATVAAAAALFCWSAVRDELSCVGSEGTGRFAALLGVHLLAAVAAWVVGGSLSLDGTGSAARFGAWLAAVLTAAAMLGLTVLPAAGWARLVGRTWRSLFVAVAIGLVSWGGGLVSGRMWEGLGRVTLYAVAWVLEATAPPAVYDPDEFRVGTQGFAVEIAPQCSGYEGIGLSLGFVGGYLWACRRGFRFPHALGLLPLAATVVWAANVVRIAALILIGSAGYPEVALGSFHSQAGWLSFIAVVLGVLALGHCARVFQMSPPAPRRAAAVDPTAAYLTPFLVLVAVSLVASAAGGPDWRCPARVVVGAGVLVALRRAYPGFAWSWISAVLGLAAAAVYGVLHPPGAGPPAPAPAWAGASWPWVGARLLGYCVVTPVAEELAFRGYLTRRLIDDRFEQVRPGRFTWWSFLASSAAFGAMHDQWAAGTAAGAVFALAYYRRGRLADAVVAHATANAATAVWAAVSGDWALLT